MSPLWHQTVSAKIAETISRLLTRETPAQIARRRLDEEARKPSTHE